MDVLFSAHNFRDVQKVKLNLNLITLSLQTSMQSSDNQLNSLSIESLHAIVQYIIGLTSYSMKSASMNRNNMISQSYYHIFSLLINLTADGNKLIESLFYQIIHWFSGFKYSNRDDFVEITALFDCLESSLVNVNESVRDVSVKALGEFFRWSLKHETHMSENKNKYSAKQSSSHLFFSKIFDLVSHPIESKRLGSIRFLIHVYRDFREEPVLISNYTLKIIFILVGSLLLSGSNEFCKQVESAIKHYLKVLSVSIKSYSDNGNLKQ